MSSIENTSTDHLSTYKVYLALALFPKPDVTLKKNLNRMQKVISDESLKENRVRYAFITRSILNCLPFPVSSFWLSFYISMVAGSESALC